MNEYVQQFFEDLRIMVLTVINRAKLRCLWYLNHYPLPLFINFCNSSIAQRLKELVERLHVHDMNIYPTAMTGYFIFRWHYSNLNEYLNFLAIYYVRKRRTLARTNNWLLLLSFEDVTTLAVEQFAPRDVTGSTPKRHRRRNERTLFVELVVQNVTVAPGDRAVLNCRVQQLGAETVRPISILHVFVIFVHFYKLPTKFYNIPYSEPLSYWFADLQVKFVNLSISRRLNVHHTWIFQLMLTRNITFLQTNLSRSDVWRNDRNNKITMTFGIV